MTIKEVLESEREIFNGTIVYTIQNDPSTFETVDREGLFKWLKTFESKIFFEEDLPAKIEESYNIGFEEGYKEGYKNHSEGKKSEYK